MSFLLWHRDRKLAIGSSRVVMRAHEVPVVAEAAALRDRLEQMNDEEARRIEAAAEEARVNGYVAGREEGQRAARDELAETITELTHAAARERERMRIEIAALALEVTRKLMAQLPADGVLVALAEAAARDMMPTQTMTLIVHPQRAESVRERLAANAGAAAAEGAAVRFEVRGDAACQLETCLIETEHGSVDASLDAQLERLARAWGVSETLGELKVAA
jgi:flagellar biosynthesis/type III secretory pathway protein FliH